MTNAFDTTRNAQRNQQQRKTPTAKFTAFIVAALMAMTGLPAHSAFGEERVHGVGGLKGVTKPAEIPRPVFQPPDRSEWRCYVRANGKCATWTDDEGRFAGCHKFARNGSGNCREEYELPKPPDQFATGTARRAAAENNEEPDPVNEARPEPSKPSNGKMLAPAVSAIGAGLLLWKLTGGDDAPFGLTPMAEWNDAGRSMGFAFRSGALQGMAMSADGEVVGRLEFELVF